MTDVKQIKDPIYGYIKIPKEYMDNIIDTPNFQRLRRVIQTSYTPLYSSAVHNRFVHSLGVYYLGQKAAATLKKELVKSNIVKEKSLENIVRTFILACLLHDVGHAPFSHTGEDFYLQDNKYDEINKLLLAEVGGSSLKKDLPASTDAAAPHEIMSAILGLKLYGTYIGEQKDREFFARCITGYKYKVINKQNSVKNCFINMLNSKVIDVDRLDYLIRDAFVSGFHSVNIDYERLLSNLTIIENDNKCYELGYKKNAVSVIENVVYSHDSERKWIQTHPIVLYESYIIRHIISELNIKLHEENKQLFSLQSLTQEGIQFQNGISVSLMCDDDIIYIMKQICTDRLSFEFFDRRQRRHPLWKSEAEYRAFVEDLSSQGTFNNKFNYAMELTANYLEGCSGVSAINKEVIARLEQELRNLQDKNLSEDDRKTQEKDKQIILRVMKTLENFAEENKDDVECDFVLLQANQFTSGFGKPDFDNINIVFDTGDGIETRKFGKITNTLKSSDNASKHFYYLFYKRKNRKLLQSKIYNLIHKMMFNVSE